MFWTRVAAGGGATWLVVCQPGAALAAVVCAYAAYSACERCTPRLQALALRLRKRWAR